MNAVSLVTPRVKAAQRPGNVTFPIKAHQPYATIAKKPRQATEPFSAHFVINQGKA